MQLILNAIVFAVLAEIGGHSAFLLAQAEDPVDRRARLLDNIERVTVHLTVDRSSIDNRYLAGERATVTMRITNPEGSPIEIYDPNSPQVSEFTFLLKGWRGQDWARPQGESWDPSPQLNAPSLTLQAGQEITFTYNSDDQRPDGRGYWIPSGGMPDGEGVYRLRYSMGFPGYAEFQVVSLKVAQMIFVRFAETEHDVDPTTGEVSQIPRFAAIFSCQVDSEYHLCISLNTTSNNRPLAVDSDGKLESGSHGLAPIIRVATHPIAITSLSASADADEKITINYRTADGVDHTIRLGRDRRPI